MIYFPSKTFEESLIDYISHFRDGVTAVHLEGIFDDCPDRINRLLVKFLRKGWVQKEERGDRVFWKPVIISGDG